MLVQWLKRSFPTGWMLCTCWMLDLRTSASVQIAKNGPRKPVYKMETHISFFLRCSVSWALLGYFPHQDTSKISLLYLKKNCVIGQWSAMKRKGLLCQAQCPVGAVSGARGAGCSHPCTALWAWEDAPPLPASTTASQVEG